jgi:hypothetical protein
MKKNRGDVKGQRRRYAARHARAMRALLYVMKLGPCKDCDRTFPPCAMDFDHARGEKKFELWTCHKRTLTQILAEIAKCDLVCACCHRIRTFAQRGE